MKNFKKVLALVLAVVMLVSFATVASAKTVTSSYYKDSDKIDYTEAVDVLGSIGVLNGYPDDTFRPEGTITRAEAAKIIAIFDNQSPDISKLYASANPFADCVGNWAESFIAYGVKTGIIAGRNATTFDPNGNVTGVEFLKMALVVLGYDAKVEGLEGKNWDVNTLALAKRVGLTDSLGNKFEYANSLKRQEAAVIMLDALRADVVEYGSRLGLNNLTEYKWGTQTFNGQVYWTVAGAISTGDKLGEGWGLTESYDYDEFRRPFRTWLLDKKELGRYMFPVAAQYTTKFDACDLLVELGVPTSNKTAGRTVTGAWINGEWQNSYDLLGTLKHDTVSWTNNCPMTQKTAGAQGTLTQVFAIGSDALAEAIYGSNTSVKAGYVVTEIDTFLAKVTKATSKTFNKEGHIVTGTEAELEVYGDNCSREIVEATTFTATTTENLKKGDFVLVRLSTHATDSNNDYVVVEMATPETKVAGFDGLRTVDYPAETRIDGEFVPNAEHFHLGEKDIWEARQYGTKLFFFDTYGNVIGMAAPAAAAAEYMTITKMWFVPDHNTGDASMHADVTTMDGKTTKNVIMKKLDGKTAVDWLAENQVPNNNWDYEYNFVFGSRYHKLYTFSINSNGEYIVNTANYTDAGSVSFTKGETYVTTANSNTIEFAVDNSTQFLLHENDGSYKAVTGYKSLDSMVVAKALYIDENGDNYADIVYFCEPTRDGDTFYAYFDGIDREYVVTDNGIEYLGYVVYVNGVKTVVYQPTTDLNQLCGINNGKFQGWVKLTYHNEGDIEYVTFVDDGRYGDAKITAMNTQSDITAVANGALTWNNQSYDFVDGVKVYRVDTDRAEVTAVDKDFDIADLAGARAAIVTNSANDITEIYVYGGWNW